MSKAKGNVDKNLSNVVDDLNQVDAGSHHAQQLQQDTNDRRHQDALNHDHTEDLSHPKTDAGNH
ncbi:hypothetical protein ACFO9Q_19100 [Paenibacillus sp. GCM10023252]|uniref:hypothetical protein n=1 Tax=Paenibacillus sp. GCM10023252 TaxID=3252649 RepID=UPI003607EE46